MSGGRSEISAFFSKLGQDLRKGFDSLSSEVNRMVKPKPKLWREWTPELAAQFKAFYDGPMSVKFLPRLTAIAPMLCERRFHYNSAEDERQGRHALCRTLRKFVSVIQSFSSVLPRFRQTVQDTALKALVRREFDLENLQFDTRTLEPTCKEHTLMALRE